MCAAALSPADRGGGPEFAGKLLGGTVGDDASFGEDEDAVGEPLCLVQVVGGQHDRSALLGGEPFDELVEGTPGLRVERPGGLVEEEQFGAADRSEERRVGEEWSRRGG